MKNTKLRITAMLIAALMSVLILAGCQEKQNAVNENKGKGAFPVTVTDVYGSTVTIDKKPERIIALAPSTVEVLYKLGLGDKIVGVTEYCNFPEDANTKEKVGSFNGANIEKIVELKPDIVLAGSGMTEDEYQRLVNLKIKVVVTEARTLAEIPATFMMIGKVTGEEDKAKLLTDEVNGKINQIRDKVKPADRVKSYYVISFGKEGNWTGGKGTFISDLIDIAGGENIADDIEGWKEYSTEQIIEKNPDIILLSSMVVVGDKDILDNEKGYKETNAVKNDRVVVINDDLTTRPGPRIVEGLELIAKAIHPEIFEK